MMSLEQAIAVLDARKRRGMTFGTDRLRAVLDRAGWQPDRVKWIHVAGTNGKGSVCRMTASVLQAAGCRVGLFTSPTTGDLLDDVSVNGVSIASDAFAACIERLVAHEQDDALSYFEMETGAALLYFSERAEYAVIECGLGGKDDATNVIPAPTVAVLTTISADHTDILGNSIADIARHKCGIAKPPCVVVTSPNQHEVALEVILRHAALHNLTVQMPSIPTITEQTAHTLTMKAGGETYRLAVGGTFQADNAMLAVQVARILRVDSDAIAQGLTNATFPCRQEWISDHPVRLIDGGHNPQGVAALADSLRAWGVAPATAVIGMLADKDVDQAVHLLAPHLKTAVCCTPPNPRAMMANALAKKFEQAGVPTVVVDDPVNAWQRGEEIAGDSPLVVAGSFYLCAAIRPHLLKK